LILIGIFGNRHTDFIVFLSNNFMNHIAEMCSRGRREPR